MPQKIKARKTKDKPETLFQKRRVDVPLSPPLLYGLTVILFTIFETLLPPDRLIWNMPGLLLCALPLLAGITLSLWAAAEMQRAGTHIPVSRPVTALVTSGPYRYSRNPIYLGAFLQYLGLALAFGSLWLIFGAVSSLILINRLIVPQEEKLLGALFGESYAAYRQRVRRWL